MGKIENLQNKINKLDRLIKFLQNLILALTTGIIWSIYALLENKADTKILILSGVGFVALIFITIVLINVNQNEDELIDAITKEN